MSETSQTESAAQGKFPKFPADPGVVQAAEHLLTTKVGRIDDVCDVLLDDPVSVLEILSRANRQFHANEKPAIWSIKVALVRLGTEQTLKILAELKEDSGEEVGPVRAEFEKLRLRARKAAQIAKIVAEQIEPQMKDEAQTAALMSEVGHMYALQRFKARYLKIAENSQRKGLAYKIEQELHLDVQKFRLDYLSEKWFPQTLLFVFDSDIKCKTASESSLRFISDAADELLDAGEMDKLERFLPPTELSSKSALRYLNVSDSNRTTIIEKVVALFGAKQKKTAPAVIPEVIKPVVIAAIVKEVPSKAVFFEARVQFIESTDEELDRSMNHFSEQNQRVFAQLKDLATAVETCDELIEEVLAVLTEGGPFKRASIIEFSPDACNFRLLSEVGSKFLLTQPVLVNDPWSPVATASTQIRSFCAQESADPLAPLGANAFAVSPLRGKEHQKLALYADCGEGGIVPFGARRVFRAAIGVLNKILPELES